MTTTIAVLFLLVYLGMILGGLPFLQLDRTGVALLGVHQKESAMSVRSRIRWFLAALPATAVVCFALTPSADRSGISP